MKLPFGYEIKRAEPNEFERLKEPERQLYSFTEPDDDDGAIQVDAMPNSMVGGGYGVYIDLEGTARSESELVLRYRQMAKHPEARRAIDDIVNEAIVIEDDSYPVTVNVDKINFSAGIKKKVVEEFDNITKLLDFANKGYELFHRWYVDGRSYFHIIIDKTAPREGIKEIRYVDTRKIRKVKEITTSRKGESIVKAVKNEYFVYNDQGFGTVKKTNTVTDAAVDGTKIAKDAIVHCTSGVTNEDNTLVLSHLHKAIKPLNQLRILEDATIIYRVSRAPERRVFYIDVGNLPKMKAEQHMREQMVKHKNRLVYNSATGEITDDRRHMSMMEDLWLARRGGASGQNGTQVDTLPAGQNLGEMDDVQYFKKNLYYALDVPITRMESESAFNLGRQSEITRDEVKFSKFIKRLRNRFSMIFDQLLKQQLILKGIITPEDWDELKDDIMYVYNEDNHFEELKDIDILRERLQIVNEIDPYIGRFYSSAWVRKMILKQSDDDIKQIDKEIERDGDKEDDEFSDDDDFGGDGNGSSTPEPQKSEPTMIEPPPPPNMDGQ